MSGIITKSMREQIEELLEDAMELRDQEECAEVKVEYDIDIEELFCALQTLDEQQPMSSAMDVICALPENRELLKIRQ